MQSAVLDWSVAVKVVRWLTATDNVSRTGLPQRYFEVKTSPPWRRRSGNLFRAVLTASFSDLFYPDHPAAGQPTERRDLFGKKLSSTESNPMLARPGFCNLLAPRQSAQVHSATLLHPAQRPPETSLHRLPRATAPPTTSPQRTPDQIFSILEARAGIGRLS
mgnify:CR=1 FL=1